MFLLSVCLKNRSFDTFWLFPVECQYPRQSTLCLRAVGEARCQVFWLSLPAPTSPTKSAFPIKSCCQGSMPVLEHSTALHSLSRNEPDILPFVLNCSSALPPKWKNNCGGKKQVAIPLTMARTPEIFLSTFYYKLLYGLLALPQSLQVFGLLFLFLGSVAFSAAS